MTQSPPPNDRISKAQPITRSAIRGCAIWLLAMASIVIMACVVEMFSELGIYIHPPKWFYFIAHLFGGVAALAGIYTALYIWSGTAVTHVKPRALIMGVLYYTITFSALAWGVLVLSSTVVQQTVIVKAQVIGASDLSRPRLGCRHRVFFGRIYAPRGKICVGSKAKYLKGSTLVMKGRGNNWATWVSSVVEVRSD